MAEQVVLKAAELHTAVADNIVGLQAIAHALVRQKLVAIVDEPFAVVGLRSVEVALLAHRDPAAWECLRLALPQRFAVLQSTSDEADGLQQRDVVNWTRYGGLFLGDRAYEGRFTAQKRHSVQ